MALSHSPQKRICGELIAVGPLLFLLFFSSFTASHLSFCTPVSSFCRIAAPPFLIPNLQVSWRFNTCTSDLTGKHVLSFYFFSFVFVFHVTVFFNKILVTIAYLRSAPSSLTAKRE